jgi:mannose-1-phosphate guanylyltransferase
MDYTRPWIPNVPTVLGSRNTADVAHLSHIDAQMNSRTVVQLAPPGRTGEMRGRSGLRHLWGVVVRGAGGDARPHYSSPRRRELRTRSTVARFRHTIERVGRLIPPERLLAVLVRGDSTELSDDLRFAGVHHIVQPAWRGTAVELFLATLTIAREDRHATVAVLPWERLVGHEGTFMDYVDRAAAAVEIRPDLAVMIGEPAWHGGMRARTWIEPGPAVDGLDGSTIRAVARFVREPSRSEAIALLDAGAMIATRVVVAKATALLALGRARLPDVLETLEPLQAAASGAEEDLLREAVYECMPLADVNSVLPPRGDGFAVLPFPEFVELEDAARLPLAS